MNSIEKRIDMTGNRLWINMMRFVLPIIISGLCRRLLHIADTMIVGRMCGTHALAAVGGTGSVIELFVWGLEGFAIGADVEVARLIGKGDSNEANRAVHTSIALALTMGAMVAIFGLTFSRGILTAMRIPEEIAHDSVMYLRIYFIGLFFNIVYNFGAACMRADGDSRRPTAYMMIAGFLNVVLDLFFIGVLGMGVAGAAIATVLAQMSAAIPVLTALARSNGMIRLVPNRIGFDRSITYRIVRIGLPACLQNSFFSISNIAVHTCLNSFGSYALAANSAAFTVEEFVYAGIDAVTQACTTFTGQNTGAGKPDNIRKVLWIAVIMTTGYGLVTGLLDLAFLDTLIGMITTESTIIVMSRIRVRLITVPLFLNGIMDVIAASMRGMGSSIRPTVTTLAGICGFRLVYLFTAFRTFGTLESLYLCYPISWILTIIVLIPLWRNCYQKLK